MIDKSKKLPVVLESSIVAKSKLFRVESLHLEFSNGVQRQYERMPGGGRGAVMIVPLLDDETLLLVREYAAGTHDYQLGFPKGLIDPGESPAQAANRELQEEAGFKAEQLHQLKRLSMAPAFFNSSMEIFIAQGLVPSKLEGDEPEPLEVIKWPLAELDALLAREDFTEGRSVAALLLLDKWKRDKANL